MKQFNKYNVYNCLYLMYRRLFRRSCHLLSLSLFSFGSYAQKPPLVGNWSGVVFTLKDSVAYRVNFSFADNKVKKSGNDFGIRNWMKKKQLGLIPEENAITLSATTRADGMLRSDTYTITSVDSNTALVSWQRNCTATRKREARKSWTLTGSGYIQKDEVFAGVF